MQIYLARHRGPVIILVPCKSTCWWFGIVFRWKPTQNHWKMFCCQTTELLWNLIMAHNTLNSSQQLCFTDVLKDLTSVVVCSYCHRASVTWSKKLQLYIYACNTGRKFLCMCFVCWLFCVFWGLFIGAGQVSVVSWRSYTSHTCSSSMIKRQLKNCLVVSTLAVRSFPHLCHLWLNLSICF